MRPSNRLSSTRLFGSPVLPSLLLVLGFVLPLSFVGCGSDPVAEARLRQQRGEFGATLEPLRGIVERGTDDPEVFLLYGRALVGTGNASLALWPLRRAMEAPEFHARAGIALARAALRVGDHNEAIRTLTLVLERDPDNVQALVLRAQAYEKTRQNYEEAIADADRALELEPDNFDALIPRTTSLLLLERVEESAEALKELERRAAEREGDDSSPHYCKVTAIFLKEKAIFEKSEEGLEVAEAQFQKCLEDWPSDPYVIQEAVDFFTMRGNQERVDEILRTSLEQDPSLRSVRLGLAMRLARNGKVDEAVELLSEPTASEDQIERAAAFLDLAGFHNQEGQRKEAVAAYEQAFEIVEEPSPELFFAYADALVLAGEYERALELVPRLPVAAHGALIEGRVHLERGDNEKALAALTRGIEAWPDNAIARYYAAVAAARLGDFARAIEEYRYSARADASATDARVRLARLYMAQGDFEYALAAVQHAVGRHAADLDMALVELEVLGSIGGFEGHPPVRLSKIIGESNAWARAVVALGKGIRRGDGLDAAIERMLVTDKLDFTEPQNSPVVRIAGLYLIEAGRGAEALAIAAAAVEAQPGDSAALVNQAILLDRAGADAAVVDAAFEKAAALAPDDPDLLLAMARRAALGGDEAGAVALIDRAMTDEAEEEHYLQAAEVEVLLGRKAEAEKRLEELLILVPFNGAAALRLAELQRDRGAPRSEAREWARRAVRFGGGERASELLKELAGPPEGGGRHASGPGAG